MKYAFLLLLLIVILWYLDLLEELDALFADGLEFLEAFEGELEVLQHHDLLFEDQFLDDFDQADLDVGVALFDEVLEELLINK